MVLEEKIKQLTKMQRIQDDELLKQEVALQQLLKTVKYDEEMMKYLEAEELDNMYSPPPLPPALGLPSIHTTPLPPSAATSQLSEAQISDT